jgi:aminopeptidase N
VSISDRYLWDATHAVVKNRDSESKDGIAMIHAVYRADAGGYDRAAEYARHTIEYMSELLFPYPWPHMTVCGGIIGGGMEYPMMTICGASSRGKLGVGLVAHELIHMWFPMIVGSNEKAHAWQDEGFTSFFGELTVAAFRKRELDLRRTFRAYRRMSARSEGAPLMTHGDYYPSGYGFASYSKSSIVLHHLRNMIGEDVFIKTFRKYVADWAYRHPRPQDFFNAFSAGAGQNLDWFFRTWYFETWGLDQAIRSVTKKVEGTEVVVEDLGYATYPTTVKATYANGKTETQSIDVLHWLSGKKSKALIFNNDVVEVELNPDRVTLDQSDSNNVWKREK